MPVRRRRHRRCRRVVDRLSSVARVAHELRTLVILAVMRIHSNYNPDVLNLPDSFLLRRFLSIILVAVRALLHVRCNQRYTRACFFFPSSFRKGAETY